MTEVRSGCSFIHQEWRVFPGHVNRLPHSAILSPGKYKSTQRHRPFLPQGVRTLRVRVSAWKAEGSTSRSPVQIKEAYARWNSGKRTLECARLGFPHTECAGQFRGRASTWTLAITECSRAHTQPLRDRQRGACPHEPRSDPPAQGHPQSWLCLGP